MFAALCGDKEKKRPFYAMLVEKVAKNVEFFWPFGEKKQIFPRIFSKTGLFMTEFFFPKNFAGGGGGGTVT